MQNGDGVPCKIKQESLADSTDGQYNSQAMAVKFTTALP